MKTVVRIALPAALALSLAGCDTLYGVQRTAKLDTKPQLDCVEQVVRATPGVSDVEYRADHSGKGLFHPVPWTYTYVYSGKKGSNIAGSLQVIEDYDGAVFVDSSFLSLNVPPPQEIIDASRPAMRSMEVALAERCGVRELPSRIKEECWGVQCAPLSETRSNIGG